MPSTANMLNHFGRSLLSLIQPRSRRSPMRPAVVLAALCLSAPAFGQAVFSWLDADGTEHFTDQAGQVPKGAKAKRMDLGDRRAVAVDAPLVDPVAPSAGATGSDSELVSRIDRRGMRANPSDEYAVANAEAWLRIAASHPDPAVVSAALSAAATLHTPNLQAGAKLNGRRFERTLCGGSFQRAVLPLLSHDQREVRLRAAAAAECRVWGKAPDGAALAALGARLRNEQDRAVLISLRYSIWSARAGLPELAEAARTALLDSDLATRQQGLSLTSMVGEDGRRFPEETVAMLHGLVTRFLIDDRPQLRGTAVGAWVNTLPPGERATPKLSLLAKDAHPYVRRAALIALAHSGDPDAIEPIMEALKDTTRVVLVLDVGTGSYEGPPLAQTALSALSRVSKDRFGAEGFAFKSPPGELSPGELQAEVARAREWYAKHGLLWKPRRR